MAQKLLSHVCSVADSSTRNLDLGSFGKVDFLVCVPPSEVTFQQTVAHVWRSGTGCSGTRDRMQVAFLVVEETQQ